MLMTLLVGLVLAQPAASGLQQSEPKSHIEVSADELASLRQEVARLKADNAALRKKLAERDGNEAAPAPDGAAIAAALRGGRVTIGMTVKQANAALKTEGKLVGEDDAGQTYEWKVMGERDRDLTPAPRGALPAREQRFPAGAPARRVVKERYVKQTVVASVQDGKIASYDIYDGGL